MSLDPQEIESKAQMLVNDPTYIIPSQVGIVDRGRIEGRADVIRRQNAAIARLNRIPEPVVPTQVPSTMGGKSKKNKKSKQSKKSKKNKKGKQSKKNKSRR